MAFIFDNLNELAQWIIIISLAGGIASAWRKGKATVKGFGDDIGL
jgi:hypothetical protein